jgi:spore coat polysaccharide biosynthesis protein SpsF
MIGFCDPGYDLVTNVARRTFPPGQSVECLRCEVFRAIRSDELTSDQREHVTTVFYDRPHDWRIRSVISPVRADLRMVVDTLEDLRALEVDEECAINFGDTAMLESV